MDSKTAHVGIEPGGGLVGRFGDTVVLIPGDAAGSDIAGELIGLIAAVASDPAVPGTMIAARLAGWVISRMPDDVIAFGVVAPVPGGVVIFLRGAVWAEVTGSGPTRRLSGEQALTWVDQLIPGPFERLAIGSTADRPVRAHPRSDLQAGVVPGQGFAVTPLGAYSPAAPAATGPARGEDADAARGEDAAPAMAGGLPPAGGAPDGPPPARPAGSSASVLTEVPLAEVTAEPVFVLPPDPPAAAPPAAAPPAAAPPAGPSPLPPALTALAGPAGPASAPRPAGPTIVAPAPLGSLVSDTGPTILLDRSYALGREPHNDPLVRSGAASPVVLQDPDHIISRVHAHVSVDNGTVTVRDASSTQGTYIARPGADQWTRIGSKPSVLLPGWSMRIGKLVFIYQTSGPVDQP